MPATNEQITTLLLPYSHTVCRSDTYLSTREKYRNRNSLANTTKSLQNYFCEHSELTSLSERKRRTHATLGYPMNKSKQSQDDMADREQK